MAGVLIVGIGHPDRGDDAVGLLVARRLAAGTSMPLDVCECSGDVTTLLDAWQDRDAVVVVDAIAGSGAPGTVHVVDLLADAPPPGRAWSNHGLGLVETVAIARALGTAPRAVTLVGIAGEHFGVGQPPSEAVSRAVVAAAAAARREAIRLTALQGGRRPEARG